MPSPPIDGGVVLVTGASSGIGVALARGFAPRAATLVLVARRVDRLERLAAELGAAHPRLAPRIERCDLADRDDLEALLARLDGAGLEIDVLVNNAGLGDVGVFDRCDWKKNALMIDVNVTASTRLVRALLPGMIARGRGGVLQVSSGFGLEFMPGFAVYVGTKHFMTAFTECLRIEVRPLGIAVTQLCPGPVESEFESVAADFEAPPIPAFLKMPAARCARIAIAGFDRDRAIVVPGILMRVALALGAVTPRVVVRALYAPAARRLRRLQLAAATPSGVAPAPGSSTSATVNTAASSHS